MTTPNKLNKIFADKGKFDVLDLDPRQKERLYQLMIKYGSTQGFTYDRFFKEGFRQWEVEGIDALKTLFLKENEEYITDKIAEEDLADLRDLHKRVVMYNTPGAFWQFCGKVRLKTRLTEFMQSYGMMSVTTVMNHFVHDDWRPYERKGIKAIVEEYAKEEEAIAAASV